MGQMGMCQTLIPSPYFNSLEADTFWKLRGQASLGCTGTQYNLLTWELIIIKNHVELYLQIPTLDFLTRGNPTSQTSNLHIIYRTCCTSFLLYPECGFLLIIMIRYTMAPCNYDTHIHYLSFSRLHVSMECWMHLKLCRFCSNIHHHS